MVLGTTPVSRANAFDALRVSRAFRRSLGAPFGAGEGSTAAGREVGGDERGHGEECEQMTPAKRNSMESVCFLTLTGGKSRPGWAE